MYALSFFIATLSLVTAAPSVDHRQVIAVASVDRSSAGRCTGTICNVAGSGDLHSGCNAITDQCQASLKLNYANTGCKVTIWKDSLCKDKLHSASVTSYNCYTPGFAIKGISVDC